MHTLTGLPRSGTTLLANILNQNPKFYASDTSVISLVIKGMSENFSNQAELTNDLINNEDTVEKMRECARAVGKVWYDEKVTFDKGRLWSHMGLIHQDLFPDSKQIVVVRDPRDAFASMEKQHRKDPMLSNPQFVTGNTILERADQVLSPDGMIGFPILGVMDLVNRNLDVVFIRYEDLVEYPERAIKKIYDAIGEDYYKHDFDKVVNVSQEQDEIYHNKFPHDGSGKIEKRLSEWKEYMSEELGTEIINRYPLFAKKFNYDN